MPGIPNLLVGQMCGRKKGCFMLRIASNLASISAQRALSLTQRDVERSMRALASGTRFSDPGADASGYAISENLRAQVKGYEAARYNADNAVSFVQLGEGALNEQGNILIRLRELAIQAASDTIGDKEREYLDYEVQGLTAEFDRIARATKFGSKGLLDGTSADYEFQVGIQSGDENIINYTHDTDTTASNLDIDSIEVADKDDARDALDTIDEALVSINEGRAKMGAAQNRMDTAVNHIDGQIENLSDAHSRMSDADVASEVAKVKRGQILQQYQATALAAANDSKSFMLRLIA
jgi:flagellin